MRILLPIVLLTVLLPAVALCQPLPDSGLVRLQVDTDNLQLRINGNNPIERDAFGNTLAPGTALLLSLPVGVHQFSLLHPTNGAAAGPVVVHRDAVTTINVRFQPDSVPSDLPRVDSPPDSATLTHMTITSDPTRAVLTVAGLSDSLSTPAILHLLPGDYALAVAAIDHDTLPYTLVCDTGTVAAAHFTLAQSQPIPLTILDLGLEYQETRPVRDVTQADAVRNRYTSLAEVFVIAPLGQGVILRAAMGEQRRSEANAMIIGGAVLSGGTWLLGRILGGRRRAAIDRYNAEAEEFNVRAALLNKDIDKQVRDANDAARTEWRERNTGRGQVTVTSPETP